MSTRPASNNETSRATKSLDVHLLGVVDFDSALFLQERAVFDLSGRNDFNGRLLLCEHPPMVTIGREGSFSQIRVDSQELTNRKMDVRRLNRGGGCFVHAPGQLAIYPIVPLGRLDIGLSQYRNLLEKTIIDVCRELNVSAYRHPGQPGIFCRCGQVAHIGISVRSWVAYHGIFLNVSPLLELLRMTQPNNCAERVTSLSAQRTRITSMHKVRESVIRNLSANLGYERSYLYTGHPRLRRTKREIYVNA